MGTERTAAGGDFPRDCHVYLLPNGLVAVFDEAGNQVPGLQGWRQGSLPKLLTLFLRQGRRLVIERMQVMPEAEAADECEGRPLTWLFQSPGPRMVTGPR